MKVVFSLRPVLCAVALAVSQPIVAAPAAASSQTAFEAFTGKSTGNKVRLRLSAAINAPVFKELAKGELIAVVGQDTDFYQVKAHPDAKAYVFRSYVVDGVVDGNKVNIRSRPDKDAPIIGQFGSGEKVDGTPVAGGKWLEIAVPEKIKLYVAKEYVDKVGGPEYLATELRRTKEVQHLLNTAIMVGQSELRKPFDQIQIEPIAASFEKIISDYSDFSAQRQKAEEALTLVRESYLQKKVAFLEAKASRSTQDLESRSKELNAQLAATNKRLAELENMLTDTASVPTLTVAASAPAESPRMAEAPELAIVAIADAPKSGVLGGLYWRDIEDRLYASWQQGNPGKSQYEFYTLEAQKKSQAFVGTLEPYYRDVRNKPGDYILRANGKSVAYFYSTQVDLAPLVGQTVSLTAIPRPNNHFAFPAYFVTEASVTKAL